LPVQNVADHSGKNAERKFRPRRGVLAAAELAALQGAVLARRIVLAVRGSRIEDVETTIWPGG
jgi:hypothetical protein